jgi:hypothetical protein
MQQSIDNNMAINLQIMEIINNKVDTQIMEDMEETFEE